MTRIFLGVIAVLTLLIGFLWWKIDGLNDDVATARVETQLAEMAQKESDTRLKELREHSLDQVAKIDELTRANQASEAAAALLTDRINGLAETPLELPTEGYADAAPATVYLDDLNRLNGDANRMLEQQTGR